MFSFFETRGLRKFTVYGLWQALRDMQSTNRKTQPKTQSHSEVVREELLSIRSKGYMFVVIS